MDDYPLPPKDVLDSLRQGAVIPAHPLALNDARKFDERRQRALTRYYLDAGSGGLAVGVHSTQFEIHEEAYGLFEPVLELAAETISAWEAKNGRRILRIAGICGQAEQAMREARMVRKLGYHAGLLSLGAFRGCPESDMIAHAWQVAQEIPLIGFYLQPAAGGVILPYSFWRSFVEIPNVIGIKVAPFNRYQTIDVLRAVAESGRGGEVALYTGNDDHIVLDLLADYELMVNGAPVRLAFTGGLLGHWACWTRSAVAIHRRCMEARAQRTVPAGLLALAGQVTDCNAAFFDAQHHYAGALCGINEVLRRQGLLENNYCLNEKERLSPGQLEEIERVYQAYPGLNDDAFVRENLDRWMQ